MIRRIPAAAVVTALIFSCNSSATKTSDEPKIVSTSTVETKRSDKLVYLDTAENMYNLLCQGWVMADDAEALSGMSDDSKFEIPYRSFYFASNGTFVKNPRNAIDYGKWEYDDEHKTITLHYSVEKGRDIYKIAALASDELKLLNAGINTSTILEFIGPGKRLKDPGEEPFDLQNNQWRIKPSKKETEAAIRLRLKENIRFFILFYKSVIEKDDREVSFWGLPSCFRWFGGGIYMQNKDLLKDNWFRCFYDKEDAMKAYAMGERLMEKKYTWPKGESNWLKQNLFVLEQMYKNVDEVR